MNKKGIVMIGMILLALGFTLTGAARASDTTEDLVDDIQEYDGSLGPGNALYGLKLAFENIDESFTFNASEKLGKQVAHARHRIAEAKAELKRNDNEAAQKAFEQYKEKIKEAETSISDIPGNDSGILNAQKMIAKHRYVLEGLLNSSPDNIGLQNAYNNSLELEDKFEEKTERHIERVRTKEGRQILKEIKKEKKEDKEDDLEESQDFKIKAKITGNDSQIEIELKFKTNSTDNATIAKEILSELRLNRDNISNLLEIENETEVDLKDILEAEAQIRMNVSKVDVKYEFGLNKTNRTDVIDGIYNRLSSLTQADIQNVLEINVMQEDKEIKKEDKEIKKEDKERKQEEKEIRKEEVRQVIKEENKDMKENRTED